MSLFAPNRHSELSHLFVTPVQQNHLFATPVHLIYLFASFFWLKAANLPKIS